MSGDNILIRRYIEIIEAASTDLTTTVAFRKWFSGSKIVEPTGQPMILYHGGRSNIRAFGANYAETIQWAERTGFKLSDLEKGTYSNPVFFFTDDDSVAASYADQHEDSHLYEVYLRVVDPLDLRPSIVGNDEAAKRLARLTGQEVDFNDLTRNEADRTVSHLVRMMHHELRSRARPHDGIIMPDTCVRDRCLHTTYAVFEPNQIKSVDNDGSFDLDDPDIHS